MKVIKPFETEWKEESPLEAFDLRNKRDLRICVVGAGGKTTTIEAIAGDYYSRKEQAIVTTTTHMFYPDDRWAFTDSNNLDTIKNDLTKHTVLWIGTPDSHGKISGVSNEIQKEVSDFSCPILIEADGSKRLPFKMPGEKEPVFFPKTTCVLGVLGLDALHKKIGDVCFRKELVSDFLGKTPEDRLEEEDYIKIIKSSKGLKKYVTEAMEFKVILNKADTKELTQYALSIRNKLEGNERLYITSHQ